jgi:HSP20 family molecular chaperone IbpA
MSNIVKKDNFFNHYFDNIDLPLLREYQFMRSDIYEVDNRYVIDIDLPGLSKDNITINYDNGYITVDAINVVEKRSLDKYIRKERFTGEIRRSFYIGDKKEQDIKATYKNGILNITFPKEEANRKNKKNIAID